MSQRKTSLLLVTPIFSAFCGGAVHADGAPGDPHANQSVFRYVGAMSRAIRDPRRTGVADCLPSGCIEPDTILNGPASIRLREITPSKAGTIFAFRKNLTRG